MLTIHYLTVCYVLIWVPSILQFRCFAKALTIRWDDIVAVWSVHPLMRLNMIQLGSQSGAGACCGLLVR